MKILTASCLLALLVLMPTRVLGKVVPHLELRVIQFRPGGNVDFHPLASEAFKAHVSRACTLPRRGSAPPPAAPIVAAIGGIVIDWAFARFMDGWSKRIQRRIAEYSAAYSNPPFFLDMLAESMWHADETCFLVERFNCNVDSEIRLDNRTCTGSSQLGLSLAFKFKMDPAENEYAQDAEDVEDASDQGEVERNARAQNQRQHNLVEPRDTYFRVLPIAMQLIRPQPKYDEGKVAVAATIRIDSPPLMSSTGPDSMWASPTVSIASLACEPDPSKSECLREFDFTDLTRAPVIPMPPRTVQALVVSIGEVAQPPQGLKGFAEFLAANHRDLSKALSDAFQKKISLIE